MALIASLTYTPEERITIDEWVTAASTTAPSTSFLDTLEAHLATRTTVLGTKPSTADVTCYAVCAPLVKSWTPEERSGEHGRPGIVRLVDFVQSASAVFGVAVKDEDHVAIDPDDVCYVKPVVDAKAEKERLKKEQAAAAAAEDNKAGAAATLVDRTKEAVVDAKDKVADAAAAAAAAVTAGKKDKSTTAKEKKEKAPKPQKAPAAAVAAPLSPALIDLRVGYILKAIKHPEADSLYVSTISMGDAPGTEDTFEYEGHVCRTVCSGLNGLIPLDDMQGRHVVVVANLKPVKMRGIKSCAMVLAASPRPKEGEPDDHKGPVELVAPPTGVQAGERVCFEGWQGLPEGVLNPKKKVWETIQPGFTTTESLEVAFDAAVVKELGKEGVGRLVTEAGAVCTVASLAGAVVR